MFGYVTPCKMELKIKDYEKFKAYYCGLCKTIKSEFGNIPRLTLNYDMTFLAVLLDSLNNQDISYFKSNCILHPLSKKIIVINNEALCFAAFCNVSLAYYKLLDDIYDDSSLKSKIYSKFLSSYINKSKFDNKSLRNLIESKLKDLEALEKCKENKSIDELSHPFAELTALILCSFKLDTKNKNAIYWLGYNLGKWIYIIDAFDDLKKDIIKQKFNAVAKAACSEGVNYTYDEVFLYMEPRINFLLTTCASQCVEMLNSLDLKKNEALVENILKLGLMEKMDKVFKRSEIKNEKSL